MAQRIKGQEVTVSVVSDAGLETALQDVVSASFTYQLDILKQRLLGETTDRKDDIFRGVEGEMEAQMESRTSLLFIDRVKGRATRRLRNAVISITMTLEFDDGFARIQLSPVYFGNIPVEVGGGDEYVTIKFTFEAEDGRILLTG